MSAITERSRWRKAIQPLGEIDSLSGLRSAAALLHFRNLSNRSLHRKAIRLWIVTAEFRCV